MSHLPSRVVEVDLKIPKAMLRKMRKVRGIAYKVLGHYKVQEFLGEMATALRVSTLDQHWKATSKNMATYISAILRCDVVDVDDPRIRQLENVTSWGAQEVARLRRADYADAVLGPRGWVRTDDVFPISVSRPSALTLDVALRTDGNFYFRFGHGAVQV